MHGLRDCAEICIAGLVELACLCGQRVVEITGKSSAGAKTAFAAIAPLPLRERAPAHGGAAVVLVRSGEGSRRAWNLPQPAHS